MRVMVRACLGAVGLGLAFGAVPAPSAAGDPQTALTRLEAVIGDAGCDDDAQCRTIAVGSKACGGPRAFLAWSSRRTTADAVDQAATALQVAEEAGRPANLRSTCSVVSDPGAVCGARGGVRRCTLRSTAGALSPL